jgi:hypothetical protein
MRRRAALQSPPTAWRPVSKAADSVLVRSPPPPPPPLGSTRAECLVYWQRPLGADASVRRLTVQVRQRHGRNAKTTSGSKTKATIPNCWALPLTLSQLPFEIRKDCAAQQTAVQTLQIVGSNSLIESDGTDVWEWICQCLQQELFVSNSIRNIHFVSDCSDKDCAFLLSACASSIQNLEAITTMTPISNRSIAVSIDGMSTSSSAICCGAGEGEKDSLVTGTVGNYTQTLQASRHLLLRELRLEYGAVWTRNDVDCLPQVAYAATSSILQRVAVRGALLADWSVYAQLIQWAESASHVAITIVDCTVLVPPTTCTLENEELEMQRQAAARLELIHWNATLQTWRRALLLHHRYNVRGRRRTGHNEYYRIVMDAVVTILRDWYRSSLDVVHSIRTTTIDRQASVAVESGNESAISMSSVKTTTSESIAQSHDGASGTAGEMRSDHSLNLAAQGQTCVAATSMGPCSRS